MCYFVWKTHRIPGLAGRNVSLPRTTVVICTYMIYMYVYNHLHIYLLQCIRDYSQALAVIVGNHIVIQRIR